MTLNGHLAREVDKKMRLFRTGRRGPKNWENGQLLPPILELPGAAGGRGSLVGEGGLKKPIFLNRSLFSAIPAR